MGRLSGFAAAEVTRKLRRSGFVLYRHGKGSHDVWRNPATRRFVAVANHPGSMPEGTLRAIVSDAGLTVDEFIAL